jgi:hypothetical protein
MDKDKAYGEIVKKAEADPHVLGLILSGGRGKGMATEHSDYDLIIVVQEDAKEQAIEGYEKKYNSTENIEAHVKTLTEFQKSSEWGTDESWNRYTFAHLRASIDKTGEIQKLIDLKGVIPPSEVKKFTSYWIGGFLNQYYRTFKNNRDKNMPAAHLDAVESIPMLLNVMFGREGRLRPYNKFLEWELKNYPLQHLPWPPEEFIGAIKKVLQNGDIETMKDFYRKLRDTSIEMGYEKDIQEWDGYRLE